MKTSHKRKIKLEASITYLNFKRNRKHTSTEIIFMFQFWFQLINSQRMKLPFKTIIFLAELLMTVWSFFSCVIESTWRREKVAQTMRVTHLFLKICVNIENQLYSDLHSWLKKHTISIKFSFSSAAVELCYFRIHIDSNLCVTFISFAFFPGLFTFIALT